MISTIMSLDVRGVEGRGMRLYLPVILAWLIACALLLAVFPLVLIAALATAGRFPGFRLLRVYPAFFGIVFASAGLRVDVSGRRSGRVFIAFN